MEHVDTKEIDGRLCLILEELRTTRLRTGILENRINDIGRFQTKRKELNLNADRKRLWFTPLESINEKVFCESLPISLDYFTQNAI